MKIIIAGDVSLRDRTAACSWDEEDLQRSLAHVVPLIKGADHAVVNLESPVTNSDKPIAKDGPVLKNTSSVLKIIRYCGFDTVTLANNHIKDYGSQGVVDTLVHCKQDGLKYVGAGYNIKEARQPVVYSGEACKVGILNVCEHESSIAFEESAGAAPLDLANLFYDIKELQSKVDKVIVVIHGGSEHYQLPTPRMKRDYRLIADFGADVVVNHHQHCFSGYEVYHGKPILYGLGNFFFDNPYKRKDKWNDGLLLELELLQGKIDFRIIPYHQCDDSPIIEIKPFEDYRETLESLNAIISDDILLKESFDKLVESKRPLCPFLPYGNHYLRALYNRGYLPDGMSKQRKVQIENAVSCETHREVLLRSFEKELHDEQ